MGTIYCIVLVMRTIYRIVLIKRTIYRIVLFMRTFTKHLKINKVNTMTTIVPIAWSNMPKKSFGNLRPVINFCYW